MNSRESSPMTSLGAPANDVGPARTLRHWLAHLSRSGRVAAIDKPVALEHELAAIAKCLDGTQAAFFTQPGGHAVPVVSGFMSKRAWIAEAMGVDPKIDHCGSLLRRLSEPGAKKAAPMRRSA